MRIAIFNKNMTKVCHTRPGDVIRFPDVGPDLYIVCRHDIGKPKMPKAASNGLYSEENPLFKVNLATGEASDLPHLSSQIEILRDVGVCTIEGC